ncbi:MAG: UvrD-helicase domain-containing protein [Simkaniaceae bacterium]|nr:UvrD-helicase domain-containing protein [Simkaniaceae bacterium]
MDLVERFNCLDPDLDVMGNHFLRASAGTGKTFAIEHIYLKLIERGLKVEEILVVTFTQKATRELIQRIGAHFSCLDGASIHTIHGFCLQALEEKTTFDLEERDPVQVIQDYFRTKVTWPKFGKGQLKALFQRYNGDFQKIAEGIKRLLGNQEEAISFLEFCEKQGLSPEEVEDQEELIALIKDPVNTMKLIAKEIKIPTPHDLLLEMEQAVQDPLFVQRMRDKYRAVIIDEFQDTDRIQWTIFSTLFLNAVDAFYLVGDEKQSIYGFRNADLDVYFEAREALGREQYLDTNFRSEPQLVEALNRFFSSMNFAPVKAREGVENTSFKDGLGPLVLFSASAKMGRSRSWPTKEMEEKYLFPFIADEILKGEFSFGSWAILVRDRFQLERLRRYLNGKKIPTASSGGGKLIESEASLFLHHALEATKAPFNRALAKKVFAHPIMGWNCHELKEYGEPFFLLAKIYEEKGLDRWIEAFLHWNLDGETIFQKLAKDLDIYSDAMQVIESRFKVDEETERTAIQDLEAVQIMTIHKSKGLEFDLVMALGVGCRTSQEDDQEEKLRQLYVALTRAKKRVYVPFFQEVGKKRGLSGLSSPMELYGSLPEFPAVDLMNYDFATSTQDEEGVYDFKTFKEPSFDLREVFSFTALSKPAYHPHVPLEEGLPGGAEIGTQIHSLLEKMIRERLYAPLHEERVRSLLRKGALAPWEEEVFQMIQKAFSIPLNGFCLSEISPDCMYPEIEFLYPQGIHFLKGFMDLVFEREGKLYLVDWKTNVLQAYDQFHLKEAMDQGDYFLQASLYREALMRHLEGSSLEWGGIYYFFLRGGAVYDLC